MVRYNYKLIRAACVAGLTLCCVFAVLALVTYADDVVNQEVQEIQADYQGEISNNEDTIIGDPEPDPVNDRSESDENNNYQDTSELVLTSISTSIQSISASDTTGFKAVILQLIGPYEMMTKEYTYTNPSSNYQSKQVTTEPDYSWMISAGIFIIVLYCFLRMLGGVICGRYN